MIVPYAYGMGAGWELCCKLAPQAVVLLHDVYPCSVQAVERILVWGKKNGYVFRALTMQSEPCHHAVQN